MTSPAFKWPGSKAWLSLLAGVASKSNFVRIVEPFCGSAAFYLASDIRKGLLTDLNCHLIAALSQIRDNHASLLSGLSALGNDPETYARVRASRPSSSLERAIRLVYLINTCWGGLYRENKKGEFNVPFGNNGRRTFDPERIRNASTRLAEAEIDLADCWSAIRRARMGDLFVVDPPYATTADESHFVRYGAKTFTWADQVRLQSELSSKRLKEVGVIVAGPGHKHWLELYAGWKLVRFYRANSLTSRKLTMTSRSEIIAFNAVAAEAFLDEVQMNSLPNRSLFPVEVSQDSIAKYPEHDLSMK